MEHDMAVGIVSAVAGAVAKDMLLWNKPYLEVGNADSLVMDADEKSIGFKATTNGYYINYEKLSSGTYQYLNHLVYPLDGKASKVKGSFFADFSNNDSDTESHDDVQVVFRVTDQNDDLLYESPILTMLAPEVDFEIDVENALTIKISVLFKATRNHSYSDKGYIRELTAVTTDY